MRQEDYGTVFQLSFDSGAGGSGGIDGVAAIDVATASSSAVGVSVLSSGDHGCSYVISIFSG